MAYVFHGEPLPNLQTVVYDGLSKWSQWAIVDKSVFYSIDGTEYVWDIYYSAEGVEGYVGIAVPSYDPSASEEHPVLRWANACYIVRKDDQGNVTFHEYITVNSTQILTIVVSNTVAYIGVRNDEYADPQGVFATVVVDQANKQHTELAVGFYDDTSCNLYDSNQTSYVNVSTSPRWHWDKYTMLIPLAGLDFGVCSGIFSFTFSELAASSVFQSMVLNGKTFYVDDNIAIIDYFVGF